MAIFRFSPKFEVAFSNRVNHGDRGYEVSHESRSYVGGNCPNYDFLFLDILITYCWVHWE